MNQKCTMCNKIDVFVVNKLATQLIIVIMIQIIEHLIIKLEKKSEWKIFQKLKDQKFLLIKLLLNY